MLLKNAQAILNNWVRSNVFHFVGIDPPTSGTTGIGVNVCGKGSTYIHIPSGVKFTNEGSETSPYWTPMNYRAPGLLSIFTDFRAGLGKAVADTAATATLSDSGLRVHGDGVTATDSGLTVAYAEAGPVASAIATATTAKILALSHGDANVQLQPDTNKLLVIDATVAMSSAITLRSLFMGFLGTLADGLLPPVTGATVTATLVQDDQAGVVFDAGFTAADRLYAVHNKSDEVATQDVSTSTPQGTGANATEGTRDSGIAFPAAGTYTRLRVEINEGGDMRIFKDKVEILKIINALDADEEVGPCLLVRSTSAATKTMLVKQFATWAFRVESAT
jgi:hypothetical protein